MITSLPNWAVPLIAGCRAVGEDIDCALELAGQ